MNGNIDNPSTVGRVYQQIIVLGMLVHMLYIALSGWLQVTPLVYYNVFSTVFYMIMSLLVCYSRYRLAVTLIHLEVGVFVTVSTVMLGWEAGMPMYLIAMASLVYIRPYRRSAVPYLFSILEIVLFFSLKLGGSWIEASVELPAVVINSIYLFNSLASFLIILISSAIFNVSSSLIQGRLQRRNEELQEAASIDGLTGALSRYGLNDQLAPLKGSAICVALGDLDDFKQVNDTYGHICGDYVLATATRLMQESEETRVCRWGGEEFLLVFADDNLTQAQQKLQVITQKIRSYPFSYDGYPIHVTMTFGLTYGLLDKNIENLVKLADERMYRGKRQGKDQIVAE